MRIICSWCLREGKIGLVGEKAPMDDVRETHSICEAHYCEIQTRWKKHLPAFTSNPRLRSIAVNNKGKRRVP